MKTLKSCSIDDQYKHVSFKDLEGYLAKDDYLSGYCEAEKELVKQNLGIDTIKVDSKLSEFSTNPVANKAITNALNEKADIFKLSKVALTGDFRDLKCPPMAIPNPEFLVIDGAEGTIGYNGAAPVKIKIPTHNSELVNDSGYLTDETLIDSNFVKGIKTPTSDIIWPEQGIITLDIPKLTGIDHELSITSSRPLENRVITRALKHIQGMIINLEKGLVKKLDDLKDVDAEAPENGQMLAYVKTGDCEGLWKVTPKPKKAGDILIFGEDGTWETVNLFELMGKSCLWKIDNNHQLIPNEEAIADNQFKGDVSTRGAIYSGE